MIHSDWVQPAVMFPLFIATVLLMGWQRKSAKRYETLHRYMSGILVLCLAITMVASALAGSSYVSIGYRMFVVLLVLIGIECVIIKSWSSWEDVRRSEGESS